MFNQIVAAQPGWKAVFAHRRCGKLHLENFPVVLWAVQEWADDDGTPRQDFIGFVNDARGNPELLTPVSYIGCPHYKFLVYLGPGQSVDDYPWIMEELDIEDSTTGCPDETPADALKSLDPQGVIQ